MVVVNSATQVAYDVSVDGSSAGSVPAGRSLEIAVQSGQHRIELKFAGSQLPACTPTTIAFGPGETHTVQCSADCQAQHYGGIRYSNLSQQTPYSIRYAGQEIATLDPGQVSDILNVRAGFDRLEAIARGTSTVMCGGTVTTNQCQLQSWSCNNELCQVQGTGKVFFRNGYAVLTILDVEGAHVTLQPGQTSEALILHAPTAHVVLRRADNGAILCGGDVAVVQCQTRTYSCP